MPRSLPSLRQGELSSFFEALYRWDVSEQGWLDGLCPSLLALFPRATWVIAQTYELSDRRFRCLTRALRGDIADSAVRCFDAEAAELTPSMIDRTFLMTSVASLSVQPELFPKSADFLAAEQRSGACDRDVLTINGLDLSECSACVILGLEGVRPLRGKTLKILRRLANHISWAVRLRRKMFGAAATAPPRPDDGGTSWKPGIDARWTLIDSYEVNGSRYIVARENVQDAYALDELSERERQVVASLASGQSTKQIACSLGIEPSTTRVLIKRAAAKLRVENRAELIAHPTVRKMCGVEASELKRIRSPS